MGIANSKKSARSLRPFACKLQIEHKYLCNILSHIQILNKPASASPECKQYHTLAVCGELGIVGVVVPA